MRYRITGTRQNPAELTDSDSDQTFDADDQPVKLEPEAIFILDDDEEEVPPQSEPHAPEDEDGLEHTKSEHQDGQARLDQLETSERVPQGHVRIKSATIPNGDELEPGMGAEFLDGDFLRVKDIIQHLFTRLITLRGNLLRRNGRVGTFMEKQLNEVCLIMQTTAGATEPGVGTALVCRQLNEVRRVREIVLTNRDFKEFSFRTVPAFASYCEFDRASQRLQPKVDIVRNEAMLVCRWKYVEYWKDDKKSIDQRDFKFLRESDADPGYAIPDALKRRTALHISSSTTPARNIRKTSDLPITKAGSKRRVDAIDLTHDDDPEEVTSRFHKTLITETFKRTKRGSTFARSRESISYERTIVSTSLHHSSTIPAPASLHRRKKKFRYGEFCAGGGGITRGADLNGWSIELLLDRDSDACRTLRRNWSGEVVCEMDLTSYLSEVRDGKIPANFDVLHVSLPCPYWSSAHTREGKNDEENLAILFATKEVLKQCRPRIVTFEQTSGLRTHHPLFFASFIHMITSEQYSLSEKIINCADVGHVQPRRRLCIIASCPGQRTPSFPKPTHGIGPGLKPFTTIADRLKKVPRNIEPHMTAYTDKRHHDFLAFNPHQQLRNAITTSGGLGDLHPTANRSYTMQELAILMDFSANHKFAPIKKGGIRRIVGNACPGETFARKLFAEVDKTLDETDREDELREAQLRRDAVVLD